jgi:oligoendopeptidase F
MAQYTDDSVPRPGPAGRVDLPAGYLLCEKGPGVRLSPSGRFVPFRLPPRRRVEDQSKHLDCVRYRSDLIRRRIAFWVMLISLSIVITPLAKGQQSEPTTQNLGIHLDFTRYFPSTEIEQQERRELIDRTKAFLDGGPWKPEGGTRQLDEGAGLKTAWMRHYAYCQLRAADDAEDKQASECQEQSASQGGAVTAFVEKQLEAETFTSLSDADLSRLHLESYRFLMQQSAENARHLLSPSEQKLLDDLADPLLDGWSNRYDVLVRQVKADAKPLQTSTGPLNPISDAQKLSSLPDRGLREAAFRARLEAYQTHRELIAATLLDIVRMETALAEARKYPSAPARKYASRLQLSEEQVKAMLQSVQQHTAVLQQYQRVRATRVTELTGIQGVHSWDMGMSSGYAPQSLSFEQARKVIVHAVAPLGDRYVAQFAWLMTPANGALDIAEGTRRQPGGFAAGYSGVPVSLYVDRFDGDLDSIDSIIHEGGHAIHRKLMNDAGVWPYYANGPNFLFEAYAIFNELLLWHELERQSATPQEKAYYQERLLADVTFNVFTSAEEGTLEQGLYDGVAAGTIRNADDIDKLNGEILAHYELFAPQEPLLRLNWMGKRLLFEDPLYLVSYLYAGLVACKLYEMSEADPKEFQKRYAALLAEGFDAPASDLIRKNMGFSLDGDSLLDGALKFVETQTSQLEQAYIAMGNPGANHP